MTNLPDFINKKIEAFHLLGLRLNQFLERPEDFPELKHKLKKAEIQNPWFTQENLLFSLSIWAPLLNRENLTSWITKYKSATMVTKRVALIMAGNIPLVGFHDILCTVLSGHNALIKTSSKDSILLPTLIAIMAEEFPETEGAITFTKDKLDFYDAVIATGSNNTARYFEYYFRTKPHLIRRNRSSVAVLTGKESFEQLQRLAEDIFCYFGLGCRNVSKLFIPKSYSFDLFFEAIYPWNFVIDNHRYASNYDYNKAVYLMSEFDLLDNGFLLVKEDQMYSSPLGVIFFEYYEDLKQLNEKLEQDRENLQVIVGEDLPFVTTAFGGSQKPDLDDYPDNIDTMNFLEGI